MGADEDSQGADASLDDVARFIAAQPLAVVSTLGPDGRPQSALVGIAVSDRFELVFDSVISSRKVRNLRRDPRVSVVIGGTMADERTVQLDGVADEPDGAEGDRIRDAYFARWPEGRERLQWAGLTHVRVTAHWIRWSDYIAPAIIEWTRPDKGELRRS